MSKRIVLKQENKKSFLFWNEKRVKGIRLSCGEAKATISLEYGGVTPDSIGGSASNCTQGLFDSYQSIKGQIARAIIEEEESNDLLFLAEKDGWEISPI